MQSWGKWFRAHLKRTVWGMLGFSAAMPAAASPVAVVLPGINQLAYFGVLASAGLGLCLVFMLLKVISLKRSEHEARTRLGETEFLLNEADAMLNAEAHILLAWRGTTHMPDRMTGSMMGTVNMPSDSEGIMDFASWLEPDSCVMLRDGLGELRSSGKAFNIGVRTVDGDLVEADGRAAGGLATLRFRPLSGERRQITELAYDARKLAKQVERLSGVLDSAPFPIWIKGKDATIQWANQAYVKATEAADINAVLKGDVQLARAGTIDSAKANLKTGLIGRTHAILNGSMRTLNVFETNQGQTTAGFAVDVTALEDAEKELERHISAHASTLNKLDTAIAIFGPDQKLNFFNSAYVALWKFEEKWLQSRPTDGEILDALRAQRNLPEQVNYREWRERQLAVYTILDTQEQYWYLPDGRSLRVICEQHPFGGVTYLYENLTKEIQLESRYNELFGVQRETLDNLAEAVSLFGSDGRLKLFNPAFARFWALEDQFLGDQPHIDTLAQVPTLGGDARDAWQDIRYGITGLDATRKVLEGRMMHGGRILRYRAVPLPDGNSLVTFTDVSDAVKAEQALRDRAEALEAADRLKNSFLANVSYEIRTPLTSIVGFAETLELGLAGPLTQKQRDYVQDIRQSSDDLKSIIDAIIDLSAIDAGAMELKLQTVDIAAIMETAAEKASPLLAKRRLALNVEIDSEVTSIVADPLRLDQILGHLLSNAIGFSPPESTIQMGARRNGDMVQLWVADSGKGIEPEFQDKAFERFQSRPLPGSHRGPGLGLALVKSFTELHGGKVSLVSKLDQGTTVVCSLFLYGPRKSNTDSRVKTFTSRAA